MKRISSILILMLISCAAFAAKTRSLGTESNPVQYQIEVIILQHTTPTAFHSSEWENTKETEANNLDAEAPYPLLDTTQFKMKKEEETLTKSPNYRILKHIAWKQSQKELGDAKQVQINNISLTEGWNLNGSIKVSLQHYFRINLDLHLKQNFSRALFFSDYKTFQLTQSRKMKSEELNYIDSPVLGALINIYPYIQKDPVVEDKIATTEIPTANPTAESV